jgi:tRNA pseudouridine synthase 10
MKILSQGYVCDHCLGRQFGQLLSGYSNRERGSWIRNALALEFEKEKLNIDPSNFYDHKFRFRKVRKKKPGKCFVCNGFFKDLGKTANRIVGKLDMEFRTFALGVSLNDNIVMKEESLWESIGNETSEPIRSEINRELGKLVEKETGKEVDEIRPDVMITLDLQNDRINIHINSIFVFGYYNKYKRGLPQTKWRKYKLTVEDIIAKPFMKKTRGKDHSLHASGREDRDARCLGWRPFVLEISRPLKRDVDLKKIEKQINRGKSVKVKDLRFSSKKEVIKTKALRLDKVYRVRVKFEKPVIGISRLRKLIGKIRQETPKRVLHRRADRLRERRVKNIKWKKINNTTYVLEIHGNAGLYVKELVSGDGGRTKPSVSGLLENQAEPKELDVIRIMK